MKDMVTSETARNWKVFPWKMDGYGKSTTFALYLVYIFLIMASLIIPASIWIDLSLLVFNYRTGNLIYASLNTFLHSIIMKFNSQYQHQKSFFYKNICANKRYALLNCIEKKLPSSYRLYTHCFFFISVLLFQLCLYRCAKNNEFDE